MPNLHVHNMDNTCISAQRLLLYPLVPSVPKSETCFALKKFTTKYLLKIWKISYLQLLYTMF